MADVRPENHKPSELGPSGLILKRGKLRPGERWWLAWLRSSSLLEAEQELELTSVSWWPPSSKLCPWHLVQSLFTSSSSCHITMILLVFIPRTLQSFWSHLSSGKKSTFSTSTWRMQGMLGASMRARVIPLGPALIPGVWVCSHQREGQAKHPQKNIAWCLPSRVSSVGLKKNVYSLILCNIHCEYGKGKKVSGSFKKLQFHNLEITTANMLAYFLLVFFLSRPMHFCFPHPLVYSHPVHTALYLLLPWIWRK